MMKKYFFNGGGMLKALLAVQFLFFMLLLSSADFFFKIDFSKTSFQEHYQSVELFGTRSDRHHKLYHFKKLIL